MVRNKVVVHFGTRKVFWNLSDQQAAGLLQTFVEMFGPAQEDTSGNEEH